MYQTIHIHVSSRFAPHNSWKSCLKQQKTPPKRLHFQVFAKGKQQNRRGSNPKQGGSVEQFLPPIDPDNEQFVIYVRSKKGLKTWFPLNVVTGGSTANTLVKGLDSNLSKDMALKSLTNNIGQALYKEQVQLEEMVRKMPMLKSARELEYGFSVLDKKNPNSMFKPSEKDVYVIPPEEETRMPAQEAAEGLKKFGDNFKKLIDGGN
ncbi:unnamed protein product [Bathycoccus prasinos]|jgi:hypothetical protein|mmetsp:Transcript_8300/g.26542  ORF Transcript_8300/g.26542 Transcript_8300/m.26542 type:complete len:206 (-) Transcript_8300:2759-3376(-)